MNLIFLAGLTPFGYGFIAVLFLSFILAYFWLKSNKKESKPGCVSIGFAAIIIYQLFLFSPYVFSPTVGSYATGSFIGVAGVAIMTVCIKKYFSNLSGLRTFFIDEVKTGNRLIITGIHRYVRHPLYTGTFLFILGLFILMPLTSLLISNFIITIYTLIGIRFEEEKLIKEFGLPYVEYQKRVPKLIPTFKPSSAD